MGNVPQKTWPCTVQYSCTVNYPVHGYNYFILTLFVAVFTRTGLSLPNIGS